MEQRYRSLPIQLSDISNRDVNDRVQVIRTGTFTTPEYGEFTITKAHLLSMKKNFDAGVRGVDLAIDFGHNSDKEAAAWIKSVELSQDGEELWATVDWTPAGLSKVKGKEYRYLSADFNYAFTDNESKTEYGCTLYGAGLTNRPVIKEMQAVVQLADQDAENIKPKGDKKMADNEQMVALQKQLDDMKAQVASKDEEMGSMKALLAEYQSKAEAAEKAAALAEKTSKFDKLLSEGKLCAAQKEAYLAGNVEQLAELAQKFTLSASGNGSSDGKIEVDSKTAAKKIMELAEGYVKAEKAKDLAAGRLLARKEHPELVEALNRR